RRLHDRAVKLPRSLVEELARVTSRAEQVWQEARKANAFTQFQPWLEKIVHLKRQEAAALGFPHHPYDALLDEYEPGAASTDISQPFTALREALVPLVGAITSSSRQPRRDILEHEYPTERQEIFGQAAAAAIGFDFQAGRLDVTAHPFCSTI